MCLSIPPQSHTSVLENSAPQSTFKLVFKNRVFLFFKNNITITIYICRELGKMKEKIVQTLFGKYLGYQCSCKPKL